MTLEDSLQVVKLTKLANGVEFTLYGCNLAKECGKRLSQGKGTNT